MVRFFYILITRNGACMLSPLLSLKEKIKKSGGFVNAHAHLDRANTARYYNAEDKKLDLTEKWKVVDNIKRKTTYFEYKKRISEVLDDQLDKNVLSVCSFIDVDSVVSSKAIIAALELRNARKDIKLVVACQTLKGVLDSTQETLIRNHIRQIDVVGSLPGADKGRVNSFFVLKTHCKRRLVSSIKSMNSGSKWPIVGRPSALRTREDTSEGPGPIRIRSGG